MQQTEFELKQLPRYDGAELSKFSSELGTVDRVSIKSVLKCTRSAEAEVLAVALSSSLPELDKDNAGQAHQQQHECNTGAPRDTS